MSLSAAICDRNEPVCCGLVLCRPECVRGFTRSYVTIQACDMDSGVRTTAEKDGRQVAVVLEAFVYTTPWLGSADCCRLGRSTAKFLWWRQHVGLEEGAHGWSSRTSLTRGLLCVCSGTCNSLLEQDSSRQIFASSRPSQQAREKVRRM